MDAHIRALAQLKRGRQPVKHLLRFGDGKKGDVDRQ
jgi:hypothetical protein